ncbi:MAG: hypothetical protein ACKOTF_08675 [Opitutaceae bacterium]
MNGLRNLILRLIPGRWARAMESESRLWRSRCDCGHDWSVWDEGGIRWGAAGEPRRLRRCPACQRVAWRKLRKVASL